MPDQLIWKPLIPGVEDSLSVGYGALFEAFRTFVADLPAAWQDALIHDNAARIHRTQGI